MKHILYATTGIALALAAAGATSSAMADVDVFASIVKNKDIIVLETIQTRKTVVIAVGAVFNLDAAAEAQAILNVDTHGNTVSGTDGTDPVDHEPEEGNDFNLHLSATAVNSINGNTGVFGFNQDVGNMSNQGNAVAVSGIANVPGAFADAQAHVEQINQNNSSIEFERLQDAQGQSITDPTTHPSLFRVNKLAAITNSINGNTGIINVNQNAGNMNNQSNAVAAALALGAVVALSDADLGQLNSGNHVDEFATVKTATITGSINGNTGIVNVNQSSGNMNNQGNVVSFAALQSGAILAP